MSDPTDIYIATPHCPTCGHPSALKMSPEWLLGHFNGLFGATLGVLIEARRKGDTVLPADLVKIVLERQPSKSVNPLSMIKQAMTKQREKLIGLGWFIIGPFETNTGYRLVALESHRPETPYSRTRPARGNGTGVEPRRGRDFFEGIDVKHRVE